MVLINLTLSSIFINELKSKLISREFIGYVGYKYLKPEDRIVNYTSNINISVKESQLRSPWMTPPPVFGTSS